MTAANDTHPARPKNPDRNGVRLVVGAGRGIGLALAAAQLADSGTRRLIATYRPGERPPGLVELAERHGDRLSTLPLDVTDSEGLRNFSEFLREIEGGVDLAIHAAGLLHDGELQPERSVSECRADKLVRLFEINSIAPLMSARALLPAQSRHRRFTFAALSAMVGSIGDNRLGGWYGYRASKTALNQFIKTLSIECRMKYPGATILAIHPGTTDTGLSRPFQRNVKPGKLYTPEQTAERILKVIAEAEPGDTGSFFHWDGSRIPW
ncbi:MAG: SDR family NAD(P)-dependent oxidoreductase [Xanthomonadales bacterium]|nr:SDR family NAD(P)-dependent oxidoreductase [Gammaproteobacteria bacterium]NNK38896.1 SDR family NAD(P)-dependent oxidoreductase [Xanthomonadales bacterium]